MILKMIMLVALMVSCHSINLLYYRQIPVDKLTLFKALLSMNQFQYDLDTTFNTRFHNNIGYYVRTKLTQKYLNDISAQLAKYNNVILGQNNGVSGQKNLIVGDNNIVAGSENWVFSEGFKGQANKDLIMDHWQVEVDKANLIPFNANLAIRKW